jgi:DNA-binding MarR family transcriptional regulator
MAADEHHWHEDLVLPALLTEARKVYGEAIREALRAAGFDDVPRLGARVLGGVGRNGGQVGNIARAFGVSRQAASKLIDVLAERGYVNRHADGSDRRRVVLELTERGELAAREIRGAVEGVDSALQSRIGRDEVARMRASLGALAELPGQMSS